MDNNITIKDSFNELGVALKNVGNVVLSTSKNKVIKTNRKVKNIISNKVSNFKKTFSKDNAKIIFQKKINFKSVKTKINKICFFPIKKINNIKSKIKNLKEEYIKIYNEILDSKKNMNITVKNHKDRKIAKKQNISSKSKIKETKKSFYKKLKTFFENLYNEMKRKAEERRKLYEKLNLYSGCNLSDNSIKENKNYSFNPVNTSLRKMKKKNKNKLKKFIEYLKHKNKKIKNKEKINVSKSRIITVHKSKENNIKNNYNFIKNKINSSIVKIIDIKNRLKNSKLNNSIIRRERKIDVYLEKVNNNKEILNDLINERNKLLSKNNSKTLVKSRGYVTVSSLLIFIGTIFTLIEFLVLYINLFKK